ncbi:MAG: hypothetical protein GY926_18990 [bacterium]|nr:hypothetical protein [bacterium]
MVGVFREKIRDQFLIRRDEGVTGRVKLGGDLCTQGIKISFWVRYQLHYSGASDLSGVWSLA